MQATLVQFPVIFTLNSDLMVVWVQSDEALA
jgi:hypothetical protein